MSSSVKTQHINAARADRLGLALVKALKRRNLLGGALGSADYAKRLKSLHDRAWDKYLVAYKANRRSGL